MKTFLDYLENGIRALLVSGLNLAASLVMKLGVRLYARNLLSAVEMRFMLGFSSALNNTSIRMLRPPRR